MSEKHTSAKPLGGTLESWEIVEASHGTYKMAFGDLYGDPNKRFSEGFNIHTSLLVKIGPDEIETMNTIYKLGKAKSDGK